jgi:hypothetical protein
VVADAEAIDAAIWPAGSTPLRIAPDDVFVLGADDIEIEIDDEHAIVEPESMFAGVWLERVSVETWVAQNAEWLLPDEDGLSQGMVAALPVKIHVEGTRALVLVPASFAHELEFRL